MKALYRKNRPKRFEDVLGQEDSINTLQNKLETDSMPHVILLYGPYGTGKTTLARIIAKSLKCSKFDYVERNSADHRGIDGIREIKNTMNQAPMNGDVRVWLFDEVHQVTKIAQDDMLKLLEEPPEHVYFILATTDPEKLSKGIQQRCLRVKLNPIDEKYLCIIVRHTCKKEDIEISKKVILKIAEYAGGSAREALQILDKVYLLKGESKQLKAIEKTSVATQTIEIARRLMNTKTKWKDIAPILRELQNEDPEQIRWMIMGYGKSVLLKSGNARAFRMIEAFRDHFYDSKFAGVVAACYEIINE